MTKAREGRGVLFFSFDNGLIDYTALTKYATSLVHRNLGLPVCVVSDREYDFGAEHVVVVPKDEASTSRFFKDYEKDAPWYNLGRERSLDLTPFRHTIVLDSDYLVMSKTLLTYVDQPLALSRSVHFLGNRPNYRLTHMPMTNMPMYWATVIVFDSHDWAADAFFTFMKKMKASWSYFSALAGLDPSLYRNDYVATFALAMIQRNRWSRDYDLPIELVTAGFDSEVKNIDLENMNIQVDVKGLSKAVNVKGLDLHVFNKKTLLEYVGQQTIGQEHDAVH